jgi:hypothetical protein
MRVYLPIISCVLACILAGCENPIPAAKYSNTSPTGGDTVNIGTETMPPKSIADASDCNPGTSIQSRAVGQVIASSDIRYTLLDVRKDRIELDPKLAEAGVHISQDPQLGMSIGEVELSTNEPDILDRTKDTAFTADLFYPKSKYCMALDRDVSSGAFPVGKTVVGYYIFGLAKTKPIKQGLWFSVRRISPADVRRGELFRLAGSFRLQ